MTWRVPLERPLRDCLCEEVCCEKFVLVVEVTLSSGQRQYESEGAPVFRHVGKCQKEYDKPVFGIFIAEKLDINMPIEFLSRAIVKTKIYDAIK